MPAKTTKLPPPPKPLKLATVRPPPETLPHAITRMRHEGWSEKQIAGQIARWQRNAAPLPAPHISPVPRFAPPPAPRIPHPPGYDPRVERAQRLLNKAGYHVTVDGLYGAQTKAAIARYNAAIPGRQAAYAQDAFAGMARNLHGALHPFNLPPPVAPPRRLTPAQLRGVSGGTIGRATTRTLLHASWDPRPGTRQAGVWEVGSPLPSGLTRPAHIPRGTREIPYYVSVAGPSTDMAMSGLSPSERAVFDRVRRAQLGLGGEIFRGVASSLVPKTFSQLAAGTPISLNQVGADIGNLALNFTPGAGAAAGVGVGLHGLDAAEALTKGLREGLSLGEAIAQAGRVAASREPVAVRSLGKGLEAVLGSDPSRLAVHAAVDAQIKDPALAAEIKQSLDQLAARYASETVKGSGKALQTGRQSAAQEWYRHLEFAGHGNPFVQDAKVVAANQARRTAMNAVKELPRANRRVLDANGIPVSGRTSVGEVLKRILLATPDAQQRAVDAGFYSDVRTVLQKVLSDPEIMAWLGSQRSASPDRGILDLTKVLDALRQGREIPATGPGSIGVAAKTMERLAQGETGLTSGARAKISDFVDSALHKNTRSWMGNHPDFGGPAVVDRWGYRSWGFADKEWTALHPKLKQDKINDNVYEFINRRYQELADEMNRIGFDGRKDWTVHEAQAMDWAAIQRYNGANPQGMRYAFDLHTRALHSQASPEEIAATLDRYGIRPVDTPVTDTGGTTSLTIFGSPEAYSALAQELADRFGEVWLVRDTGSTVNRPHLIVSGDDGSSSWIQHALDAGFTHGRELPDGTLELFAARGGVNQATLDALTARFEAAGMGVESRPVELQVVHGRADTTGAAGGLPDLSGAGAAGEPVGAAAGGRGGQPAAAAGPGEPAAVGAAPAALDEFGQPVQARFASGAPDVPPGTLYHGAPRGEIGNVDALYHTRPWREGPGFYLTPDVGKATRYARGRTAKADVRAAQAGVVHAARLKPGTRVLNLDAQPESFWRDLASQLTGEPVDEHLWRQWASDIPQGRMSEGVWNRQRLMHFLTGYAEMPQTDAYYTIEEMIHDLGYQATLHHEGGVPVFIAKDSNAVELMGAHAAAAPPGPVRYGPVVGTVGHPTGFHFRFPADQQLLDEFGQPIQARFIGGPLRGRKAAREAQAAQERAALAQAARDANASRAAYKLAQEYGVPIGEVTGSGRDGRVLAADVKQEWLRRQTPGRQLKEGLRGGPSGYGKQRRMRKEANVAKGEALRKAYAIEDPAAAEAAAAQVMRGPMPSIEYHGLKQLTPETILELKKTIFKHPTLREISKFATSRALDEIVAGKMPTPSDLRLIEHVFGPQPGLIKQLRERSLYERALDVANIPRSLQATADLSAIFRQSLVAGMSHPLIWGRNFPVALSSMFKPESFKALQGAIRDSPWYSEALAAGIQFTDIGEHTALSAHEEQFASDIAAKLPVVGHVVKGSARSYAGFLNKMRMDLFEQQMRTAQDAGRVLTDKELKDIGKVINAATGRGSIGEKADHLLPAMNTFLFSPRLMLSRINYLNPAWYARLSGPARKEALRGLIATAGAVSGALYLFSQIPGVEVNWRDPTNADWGKLRIGNTRIDIAGGFQQYVHLAAELLRNQSTSSTTGKTTKFGGFGNPTRLSSIGNFFLNKLAPPAGFTANMLRGKDAVGNPVSLSSWGAARHLAWNYLTPLLLQDAWDLYKERHQGINGLEWALAGIGLGGLGLGLQTYQPKPPKPASTWTGGSDGGIGSDSGSSDGGGIGSGG